MIRCILAFLSMLLASHEVLYFDLSNQIIPRRVLFGNPDKTNVSLSPNGNYISYSAPKDGVMNLWIANKNDISGAIAIIKDTRWYCWAYDNKHILYNQDNNGDENFRLYAYNLETKETILLTPKSGTKTILYQSSSSKPDEILIGLNERDNRYFDVYKLSFLDYSKELIIENNKFSGFIMDNNLSVRFAIFNNKDGDKEYFQLKDGHWTPFMKIKLEDSQTTYIIGFDKTNIIVYLSDSRGRYTAAIKSLNLGNGKMTIIAKNKKSDVHIETSHPTEKNIQMWSVNYDKKVFKILDKSIKYDIEYLQRRKNTGNFSIDMRTLDDKIWLISYYSDISPVQYYIYDRTIHKAKFLFSSRPELEKYKLSSMKPVIIKTRDGLNMVSYLTLPNLEEANKPLPLVLYVHGGPHLRDTWGLNPIHQWLANRGYAVLSVNYRGSTGFGKKFLTAGYGEWGRKMQDDLIDAVNWAIKRKIADPKRICIMGGSYGGYATLAGLAFTPDVFACGVDIVGISNLVTFLENIPSYWKSSENILNKRIGVLDTLEDREDLKQRSPLTFAQNIKKPLLIGQGANDPRVKQSESDQIVQAMRKNNIPVTYVLYTNEGHGFRKTENKLSFYAITEQFLTPILKGRSEPMGNELKGAKFLLNGKSARNLKFE